MARSFRDKRADSKDFPRVQPLTGGMERQFGPGTVVIPAPMEVDGIMRKVRKGKLITINQIREIVARRHGATIGCPIATGILARICAGAAGEEEAEGKKRVTPYWRTLKAGGELNAKYPGGIPEQRRRLVAEGHHVLTRGVRSFVTEYEKSLVQVD